MASYIKDSLTSFSGWYFSNQHWYLSREICLLCRSETTIVDLFTILVNMSWLDWQHVFSIAVDTILHFSVSLVLLMGCVLFLYFLQILFSERIHETRRSLHPIFNESNLSTIQILVNESNLSKIQILANR